MTNKCNQNVCNLLKIQFHIQILPEWDLEISFAHRSILPRRFSFNIFSALSLFQYYWSIIIRLFSTCSPFLTLPKHILIITLPNYRFWKLLTF